MLFNSLDFLLFFSFVYLAYWLLKRPYQNYFLLIASYFFYGYWDWRFLSLILLSTTIDYFCGQTIHRLYEKPKKGFFSNPKLYLWLSVVANLSILIAFKFYGFFVQELKDIIPDFLRQEQVLLSLVIPIGVSFYTFQTMSYTIDIYRKRITPTSNFFHFALFVSFFPQLLAGPIERAGKLIPQIESDRKFDPKIFQFGIFLVLWGLFQKVVVADNLLGPIGLAYGSPKLTSPSAVVLANYAAAIQIYCDFAGYSNMAKGLAALLGFRLSTNFYNPFFAHNPTQFWERWHMTLTQWLKDYLFFPLARLWRPYGRAGLVGALLVTMTLVGAWHGANWTFFLWGFVHGVVILIYNVAQKGPIKLPGFLKAFIMFNVFCIVGQLFLVPQLSDLKIHWQSFFSPWNWQETDLLLRLLVFAGPLFIIEWLHEKHKKEDFFFAQQPRLRWVLGVLIYLFIILSGVQGAYDYVYFQF